MATTSGHKLTIETPELITLEFSLAGVGSRFLALAIDTLIQIGLMLVILLPIGALGVSGVFSDESGWLFALFILAAFAIQYFYFAIFEAAWNGQTPGKRRMSLRVVKDSGLQISGMDALTRNLIRIADQIPGFYAVGIASALISPQGKRLGDYVAGTVVIQEAPYEEWQPSRDETEEKSAENTPVHRGKGLSPEELEVIETFLDRREQLEPGVREEMADKIIKRLAPRFGVSLGEIGHPEEWLEKIARSGRRLADYL